MLLSLDSGVSALDQFQQDLNVIGNNIANVDTVGFKSANMQFADALSQTIGANAAGVEQIGTGVVTSSITDSFTQGSITSTGVSSNLAIDGNGFFIVKDPTSGEQYVTRDGNFTVDSSGYLVNSVGMRVQGYTNSTDSTVGDIQITNANDPTTDTSAVQSYTIGSNGDVNVLLADGSQFTGGQVLLQNFTSPTQLTSVGNNLFNGMAGAGPLAAPTAPTASGLGTIVSGSLEMSNVDLASQLTALITAQRGFEANAQTVTTSNEVLQDLVNLKH
ncbi:MAG TPA: flagellar hook-basal body complex protein [Candidatus Acidoferrales bacterium]|jgi:flagellar hook protein FlgE|nr:flagellar hook-basal body complex protein [Candidatus Acidoferrales bacterium]